MTTLGEVGQFIVTAGATAIGLRFAGFRFKRERKSKEPDPVCGCDHHFAMHDLRTGECHGLMDGDPIKYYGSGTPSAYKQIPCTCQHYTGPEPMNAIFGPPPPFPRPTDKEA